MMFRSFLIVLVVLFCRQHPAIAQKSDHLLSVVNQYADNVLKYGLDRWSGMQTPLLADGVNVHTGEPVEWVYYDKSGKQERWIIHNLASQQNLFRMLVGLSNLTGDKKYRKVAKDAIRYHFDKLQSDDGLLRWGGHQFIDLKTLQPVPYYPFTPSFGEAAHEFKLHYPFYELMWEVDSAATASFIRGYWNAHIIDWHTLDMNHHGKYHKPMGFLWKHDFDDPSPFFEGQGLTFLNAEPDLIYAGTLLYQLHEVDQFYLG